MISPKNIFRKKILKRLIKKEVRKVLLPILKGKFGIKNQKKAFFYLLTGNDKRKCSDSECLEEIKFIEKYDKIIIRPARSERIGEFITRFLFDIYESRKKENKNIKFVYIPMDYKRMNTRLFDVLTRQNDVVLVKKEDLYKWRYLGLKYKKINADYRNPYGPSSSEIIPPELTLDFSKPILELTADELKEGKEKAEKMGVTEPFVCIFNRDSAYLTREFGRDLHVRNSSIHTRKKSVEYLYKKGITAVRMGREVQERIDYPGCVDYASDYYDELMDLYFSAECKFFIGEGSGANMFAYDYGTPIALINDVIPNSTGTTGFVQDSNVLHILIFKKFYYKEEDRYLNLNEMIKLQWSNFDSGISYWKYGIELIENTEEEIYDVTVEMNERIDGTWVETEEDEALQKKYWDIVYSWYDRAGPPFARHNAFVGRIGAKFLRENQYLFDIDKVSPAWEKKFEGVEYMFPVKGLNA